MSKERWFRDMEQGNRDYREWKERTTWYPNLPLEADTTDSKTETTEPDPDA